MAKAKLTPQMKIFIEKNVELSNRFLSERITENYKISVSHVIVGRHKKSFLETGVETQLETSVELLETSKLPVETQLEISVETEKTKIIRKIKRVTAEKMIENIIIAKVNRGMSNERILELAKFVVDQIYEDCLEKGN